jgi:hypothetical protein
MARIIPRILFGFLSTAGFIAAFALAGDVLVAAIAALTIVIVQFVFGQTTQAKPGVLMWVSLALIIGLTSLSLAGTANFATTETPAQVSIQTPDCACSKPQTFPAQVTTVPLTREAPNALAPTGRRV